jgi:hypothetical protein
MAGNAALEEAKDAEQMRLQAIQDQADRDEEAAMMAAKEAELQAAVDRAAQNRAAAE